MLVYNLTANNVLFSIVIDCSMPTITKFRVNWTQWSNKVTVTWTPAVLNGSYEVSNASNVAKVRPLCKRLRYEVRSWEWKEPQNIPDNIQNVTTAVFDEWSQRSKRYYLRRRHLRKSRTAKFAVLPEKFYTFSVVIGHTKTFEDQPVAIQASHLLFTGAQGEFVPLGPVRSLYTSIILPEAAECVPRYLHYSTVHALFITIFL